MTMQPRRLAIRALQLALLALIAWGIYRALAGELSQLTWADLARWRPGPFGLLVSFAMLVAVYIAHALLWRRIMRDLAIGDLSLRDTIRVYFTASLGRYVPGKVWQLAGMAVLAGRAGLPPVAATAAAVLGQIAFLATGMLFLGLTLPGWRAHVAGGNATGVGGNATAVGGYATAPGGDPTASAVMGGTIGGAAAWLVVALIVGGALLWLLVATPLGQGAREHLVNRMGPKAAEKLRSAFELADRVTPRNASAWAVAYFITWIGLGGAFAVFVTSFVPEAAGFARYLAGTIAASYLLGYLVPLPAGIGAREGVMLVLLQPVVPDAGAAVVISILSRVWFTAAELVPLAMVPLIRVSPVKENSS